ncbi:DUF445 domain-containing protein [Jatrophihabitans sp.]|uniref:DUF445 domain-containing protein n=1 Tax=Jatrophihabitans sp. TaxID=1932789 RepID=UPI0030C6BED1|nr:hypothetical protein [Jatrophihabitans sp.]
MTGVLADIADHWYIDLSIPVVAAVIGYLTKLVAIRMMFEPIEFIGFRRPYLGWQGIVPRRAARMASIAVDTMTRELISAGEVVARLDPELIAKEIAEPMRRATEEVVAEIMAEYQPGVWEAMPEAVRNLVIMRAQAETPRMIREVLADIQRDVDAVFDLKAMVLTNLLTDKRLLNRIFREAGHKEFRFIIRSGIYFGGTIGLLQMTLWVLFHEPLIMPAFGLIVGWFTDWLALKLIFNPKRPITVFRWHIQGLFLKRRREVAADYGALIADEIITPEKVIGAILNGPLSDRVFAMVRREVQSALDRSTGIAKPLVVMTVGSAKYDRMKRSIASKVMARLPETMVYIEDYARESMDIRNLLVEKMQQLDELQFEALIRPAFEQDEWILITVGAVLGFVMGEAQALVLEHFASR